MSEFVVCLLTMSVGSSPVLAAPVAKPIHTPARGVRAQPTATPTPLLDRIVTSGGEEILGEIIEFREGVLYYHLPTAGRGHIERLPMRQVASFAVGMRKALGDSEAPGAPEGAGWPDSATPLWVPSAGSPAGRGWGADEDAPLSPEDRAALEQFNRYLNRQPNASAPTVLSSTGARPSADDSVLSEAAQFQRNRALATLFARPGRGQAARLSVGPRVTAAEGGTALSDEEIAHRIRTATGSLSPQERRAVSQFNEYLETRRQALERRAEAYQIRTRAAEFGRTDAERRALLREADRLERDAVKMERRCDDLSRLLEPDRSLLGNLR